MKFIKGIIIIILVFIAIMLFISVFNVFNSKNYRSHENITSKTAYERQNFVDYIQNPDIIKNVSNSYYFKTIQDKGIVFNKVKNINNEKYAVLGYGDNNNLLYEFDIEGNIQKKFLIESGYVRFYDFAYKNGSYIFVGEKGQKPYILSIDSNGGKTWSNIFQKDGRFYVVNSTLDGFIVGGYSKKDDNRQAYIAELNSIGNKIWDSEYGREDAEEIKDIYVNPNYIVAVGVTNSNPKKQNDILILKYSREGVLKFDGEYGNSIYDEFTTSAIIDENNKLYVSGYIVPENQSTWKPFLLKTVSDIERDGQVKPEFFETKAVQNLSRILEMKKIGERIYTAGFSVEKWPDYDGFIKIMNLNGNLIEQKIFGTENEDRIYSFDIAEDHSIIAVGYQSAGNTVYPLILKTDSNYRLPGYEK
ncbi:MULTISPECIES: hypothetical protein [Oceanotoga]|jgi:hypothetical protein|uniref:Uncharacterized protein n=1 Tax=Oceanotoga teriensis TaxID=515440 RepID=A0AA45C810_9BACT|nr:MULTISPECIES: hypothetical protein [Oceanotoga]MDN5341274.1 hypothetical protein [Oceanotoga sp.]PWJ95699.1 hypothetical protein C7380_104115 [Oceanotoga teriensis]